MRYALVDHGRREIRTSSDLPLLEGLMQVARLSGRRANVVLMRSARDLRAFPDYEVINLARRRYA